MNKKIETESNKIIENPNLVNLIGILLTMPIYSLFSILLEFLNLNNGNNLLMVPTLIYLPIIIGMSLSYKLYKNKISKLISISILLFLILGMYFYCDAFLVENTGWDGLYQFILWLITTGICKLLSCIFYGKIVGWKKGLTFSIISILIVASSIALGFWA